MDVTIETPILWTEELYAAHRAAKARVAEEVAVRQAAEARAAEEATARKILERQIRALKEELDRFRKG